MTRAKRWPGAGFTFIELMMSLAILGVLVMVAMPMGRVVEKRRKEHELRVDLIEIRAAIDDYKHASEQGRILMRLGDSGYPPDLDALWQGVPDQHSPTLQKIYFLRRVPPDPFGDNVKDPAASWGLRSYTSPPDLPAPGNDVYDVYSKSTDVGLNGVPYRQW